MPPPGRSCAGKARARTALPVPGVRLISSRETDETAFCARRGAPPPFRCLPPGGVARAKPALETTYPFRVSASLLHPRRMKRRFHDARRTRLAADVDAEVGTDGRVRRLDVGERDRLVDRRAVRPGGDHAQRVAVLDDRIAVTGHRAVGHLDAHELAS